MRLLPGFHYLAAGRIALVKSILLDLQPSLSLVLTETQGANVTRYVHAPRGIHAQKDASGNWEWMVNDGLGSVREVLDNSVSVLWSNSFDPIGNGFSGVGISQTDFGFTGEQTDIVGLVYLRNRYMSPALGQFISQDFLESLNRYVYASANPTNRIDLNGLQDFSVNCQYMLDGNGVPVWVCDGSSGTGSRFGDVFRPTNGISNFGTFTQPGSINWNAVGIGSSQNGQRVRGLEQAFCMDPERCAAMQVQLYTPQIQLRDPCDDNPGLCGGVFVPDIVWDFDAATNTGEITLPRRPIDIRDLLLELLRRYGWCLGELLKWLELARWLDRTIPWEREDEKSSVVTWRGVGGNKKNGYWKNPSLKPRDFRQRPGLDDDGLSFFEFGSLPASSNPYAYPFTVEFEGEKIAGVTGFLIEVPTCRATHTPPPEGHWSVNCVNIDNLLSSYAEANRGKAILYPNFVGDYPEDRRFDWSS